MKILKSQLKKLIKESTEEQIPRLNKVDGDFRCENNNLTSLQGAPKYVGGNFYCYDNDLSSLQGASKYVGGDFICSYNELTSLQGAPKYVGGYFSCSDNIKKFTEEEVRAVCDVKGDVHV